MSTLNTCPEAACMSVTFANPFIEQYMPLYTDFLCLLLLTTVLVAISEVQKKKWNI
jgi:hypothetical protein